MAQARLRSSAFARWTAICRFGASWRESRTSKILASSQSRNADDTRIHVSYDYAGTYVGLCGADYGTDYSAFLTGSWDSQANHQAAIFGTSPNSVCTDRALRLYTDPARGGVHPSKLVLGASALRTSSCSTKAKTDSAPGLHDSLFGLTYRYAALRSVLPEYGWTRNPL